MVAALHEQARRTSGWPCRGAPTCSTPSRSCCRTTCWPTPGRCSATSSGSVILIAGWPSARTDRRRWPGTSLGLDPGYVARVLGFEPSVANSIDGTAARDLVAEAAYVLAQIGVDLSRLSEDVIIWVTHEFGFARLARRVVHRVEHHAAEEESGRRGAGPRQGRTADRQPHRTARHLQGPAAGLQPGSAGGQGAGLRLGRPAADAVAGGGRHGRDPDLRRRAVGVAGPRAASRWPPTSPTGSSGSGCRSPTPTTSPAPVSGSARSAGSSSAS